MNVTEEMLEAAVKAYRGDSVVPAYMLPSMKLAIEAALALYISKNTEADCVDDEFDYEKCCEV